MFYFDKLAYKGKLTKECLDWFVILDKKKKITNRAKSWSIWSHSFHWTDLICIFPEKKKNLHVSFIVQSLNCVRFFATPHTAAHQAFLSFPISQSLLKFMSFELVLQSNHLILFCPLLFPPSIFPRIRVFSIQSALRIRWPKHWSVASASVLPMNIQVWFPFRTDWFYLLEVQGILKSLLQDHNLKASGLPLKCQTLPSQ